MSPLQTLRLILHISVDFSTEPKPVVFLDLSAIEGAGQVQILEH